MKYLYRFEEMVETREKIINDTQNVINEQKELIAFLNTHPEKRFELLVNSLETQISQSLNKLADLIAKNENTKKLINKIKKASKTSVSLLEDLLDELAIFNQQEEVNNE